jgi:hypothetical protein
MKRNEKRILRFAWLLLGFFAFACPNCTDSEADSMQMLDMKTPPALLKMGVIVGKVGDKPIYSNELDILAGFANRLRKRADVALGKMDSVGEKLKLAMEVLSLAELSDKASMDPRWLKESNKRQLVEIYLRRLIEKVSKDVTQKELDEARLQAQEQYRSQGEFELFVPSSIEASYIAVGAFPSLQYLPDDEPILDEQAIHALSRKIRQSCGDRVESLDAFMAIEREYATENPTVRFVEMKSIPLRKELDRENSVWKVALRKLKSNGEISPVVYSDGAAFIVRRGAYYEGQGESLLDARKVIAARQRQLVEKTIKRLKTEVPVKIYLERISKEDD